MAGSAPPLTTAEQASCSKSVPSTPLLSTLSRLSQSTSRPSIVTSDDSASYTTRTMRFVNRSGKEAWRRSGLGSIWSTTEDSPSSHATSPELSKSSPTKTKSRSTLDVSSILYPTLHSHPAPASHPILVLSLSQISAVSPLITNDELFDVLLRRLEPWVGEEGEGGYVLAVLAADDRRSGERKWPGMAWWVWKWKRIPRKYRKNLKRLYIVHPSLFTRTLLPLFLPLISPKSYPKLHPLSTLLALYHIHNVPLSGIDIPLAVLHEESRILRERLNALPKRRNRRPSLTRQESDSSWGGTITSTISAASAYFPFGQYMSDSPAEVESGGNGYWRRTIDELIAESGGKVPALLVQLRHAILEGCTQTEGVFRRTSNSLLIEPIVALLDLPIGEQSNLPWKEIAFEDPLLPPKILLRFLGDMEEPIIPPVLYTTIRSCTTSDRIRDILLPALDLAQELLMSYIVHLLHDLSSHEITTKMSPLALAIVAAPTLIDGPDPLEDAEMCLPPGKSLPKGMGGKDRGGDGGTLVGVLEIWIREWEALSGGRQSAGSRDVGVKSTSPETKHGLLGSPGKGRRDEKGRSA